MIELPEAVALSNQINKTVLGKKIISVIVAQTPHKLAWFYGDPLKVAGILSGKTVGEARAFGGLVEIKAGKATILFGEGSGMRFHAKGEQRPLKHQLLIEFEDHSALSAVIRMYGGLGSFEGELENPYYKAAKDKPSPLLPAFDEAYFNRIVAAEEAPKLSLKGLLATGQRIPGLGNGVLQDILFNAGMHPKKKVNTLTDKDRKFLFVAVKTTLISMANQGGRNTELDLFGNPGGYQTKLCSKTASKPCPVCKAAITKEAYMGGSIYYCGRCQKK
jgi:formamidopyrimidine-DNA glycosylase